MPAPLLRVASVCSGIGGAELAFHGIAQHAFAAEIEQFPRAVLAHHFPGMKLYGDFTEIPAAAGPVDVLVGGTPCQSFSVAGLRGGMADARGNLALEFLRLAERLRARWVLWENVPGVLSSADGRDFGAFVGGLAELGYGWAYRVLDAQYFGLAQRRKRVFVVGHLGDWRHAAAVLFEPSSLRGDTAPCRETGQRTAATLTQGAESSGRGGYAGRRREDDVNLVTGTLSGIPNGGGLGTDFHLDGGLIADTVRSHPRPGSNSFGNIAYGDVARCLNAHPSRIDGESETFITHTLNSSSAGGVSEDGTGRGCPIVTHSLRADGFDASEDGTGRGTPLVAVAFDILGTPATRGGAETDVHTALRSRAPGQSEASTTTVIATSAVRRLTPTECERLQGFPDGWTEVAYRGKPAADGPRYRALGNAFAVPVVRWIARRIVQEVGYNC